MKKILLSTAVLLAVGDLRQVKQFSVHDITNRIRDAVNKNEIQLIDVPEELQNGKRFTNIRHEDVKAIFNELYDHVLSGLSKQRTGAFFTYTDASSLTAKSSSPAPVSAPVQVTKSVPPQGLPKVGGLPNIDTVKLINYLGKFPNGKVSMKQIQSRFKDQQVSCEEYAKAIKFLGLTVDTSSAYSSKWFFV